MLGVGAGDVVRTDREAGHLGQEPMSGHLDFEVLAPPSGARKGFYVPHPQVVHLVDARLFSPVFHHSGHPFPVRWCSPVFTRSSAALPRNRWHYIGLAETSRKRAAKDMGLRMQLLHYRTFLPDQASFEALLRRHGPMVYGAAI